MSTKTKAAPSTPKQTKKPRLVTPGRSNGNDSLVVEPKTLQLQPDDATDSNEPKASKFNLSSIASFMKKEEKKADADAKKGIATLCFSRLPILLWTYMGFK